MPPQTISLAIWLIQELIQHEPEIAAGIKSLLTKAEPTADDWDALHAKVAAKSYRDYVPDTALPAAAPSTASLEETVPIRVLPTPVVSPQADKPVVTVTGSADNAQAKRDAQAQADAAAANAKPGAVPVPEPPAIATLNIERAESQSLTAVHLLKQ